MKFYLPGIMILVALAGTPSIDRGEKYQVKKAETEPPKSLHASIRDVLGKQSIQFLDENGKTIGEIWFRKSIPADALAIKGKAKDIRHADLMQATLLGAIRLDQEWTDYRKQKIDPGVYTMRLGFQPQDGDHMGTSPFQEFVVLIKDKFDTKVEPLEPEGMVERSAASINTAHPAVWLLFPAEKNAETPKLLAKENNHLVLVTQVPVEVGSGKIVPMGISLALVGHATE